MGNIKVELNSEGVRDLMKSAEMMSICKEYANSALGRLGGGYEVNTYNGQTRCNAEVAAVSFKAKRENLKNNSIIKAVWGK